MADPISYGQYRDYAIEERNRSLDRLIKVSEFRSETALEIVTAIQAESDVRAEMTLAGIEAALWSIAIELRDRRL